MQDINIRRAEREDLETLIQLGRATFTATFGHLYAPQDLETFLSSAYGADFFRHALDDSDRALWLAEQAGRPLGHALAGPCELPHPEVTPQSGEIKRLYLTREAQGAGVGAQLFETMVAWLESEGRTDMWLGVWSENHGAQRFYGRYGFAKVGEYGFPVGATIDSEFIFRRCA